MTEVVTGTQAGDDASARSRAARRGPVARLAASGFGRIAGISASLVGTQALTSVLGLLFWALAARQFLTGEVGVAGAAVAMMMLLGSLGSLGLGTVLIARLPGAALEDRRVLVRTCLAAAGAAGTVLGLVVPALAVHVFGATNLAPIGESVWPLLGLALGTGLTSVVMVLDQAVLTIGLGTLQLERNVVSSGVKVLALLALGLGGVPGGMTIFLAWTIGNLVSLPIVSWRTRGGRAAGAHRGLVEPSMLRGIGRLAISHHALNVSIQAALQLLPVLVVVVVSAQANAAFNSAIMLSGFVFALPYAVSVGLFAAARGDETEVVRRMRLTIPFGLAVSVAANIVLFPLAGPVLQIFGPQYAADGTVLLRLVVLAGIPFVIKDHFIALRRVQGRTSQALVVTVAFLVAELAAATVGALTGGVVGLVVGWLCVLAVEALVLAVPLVRAYRADAATRVGPAPSAQPTAVASTAVASTAASVVEAPVVAPPATTPEAGPPAAPALPRDRPARPSGWAARNLLGPLLLIMAVGVFGMAVAANLGRLGDTGVGAQLLWYAGLVLVFLPAAIRILGRSTPHLERIVAVVSLALVLQVSRLVLNPTMFVFHDEFIHADTLRQIDETGHLFTFNPLLPVSAYYPGLEIVTDAVRSMTGLPVYAAAVLTLLIARLVLVLAIIGVIGAIGGSRRAGAVGALVYLANPQLLFFNSQYSYQSLALPLAVLCVYLVATRRRGGRWSLVLPLAATAAVVVTHHLTAVLLLAAYLLWLIAVLARGGRFRTHAAFREVRDRHLTAARDRAALAILTIWGAVVLGLSVLNPGNPLAAYLEAIFGSSSAQLIGLSEGQQPKALFSDSAGTGPMPWEQLLLIASVLLTTASLLVVLGFLRTGWRGAKPLALALGIVGLLYPVVPGGHLTSATAEVGDRASGFVFVGLAAALGTWWWARHRRRRTTIAFALAATVTFLGSIVLGSGPASGQLPGPYQVSADARSVDADNIAAAQWQATGLPDDSVVYGDRVSGLLAAADGGQRTVLHVSTDLDISQLLLAPTFTSIDVALITKAKLDYLIVDERLSTGLPHQQFYIESGEYGGQDRTKPVSAAALAKFAAVPGVTRVYDNGSLAIYDVRGLR
jgi:O-antigen/teichoic acid export membrane protein